MLINAKGKGFFIEVAMNDRDLIDDYANLLAEKARQDFIDDATEEDECFEGTVAQIESPIERRLCLALLAVKAFNNLPLRDIHDFRPLTSLGYMVGIDIEPQFQIDEYRIDFKISNCDMIMKDLGNSYKKITGDEKTVLVECDSQEWHERTEKERRYEKARDRYLVRKGFAVFHYTGKEILEDPIKIAEEVFTFIGCSLAEMPK